MEFIFYWMHIKILEVENFVERGFRIGQLKILSFIFLKEKNLLCFFRKFPEPIAKPDAMDIN